MSAELAPLEVLLGRVQTTLEAVAASEYAGQLEGLGAIQANVTHLLAQVQRAEIPPQQELNLVLENLMSIMTGLDAVQNTLSHDTTQVATVQGAITSYLRYGNDEKSS